MKNLRDARGFTLIELLVVVAIIGILAAIAIPQFALYRQRGYDSQANSDLRNAATAEEAYFAAHETYKGCSGACSELPGFKKSASTTMSMSAGAGTFSGTSTSSKGTGRTWTFNSTTGLISHSG
jgi:type IV pilus assembly protein PilA